MQLNQKRNHLDQIITSSLSSSATSTSKRQQYFYNSNLTSSTKIINQLNMTNHSAPSKSVAIFALLLVIVVVTVISVECHIKRTQYHEQGIHGPKSYKFGFTAGDHKNPQERHETSDGHGHVKGWYSFIDPHGKHQVIHYEAHPKYGFKVYNHKSKAYNNGKRHYGS